MDDWILPGWRYLRFGSFAARRSPALPRASRSEGKTVPPIIFLWESFGPHHVDRCVACAEHFAGRAAVVGIEIATFDSNYQWRGSVPASGFTKITLFPARTRQAIGIVRCFLRIVATCLRLKAKYIFVCNYNEPAIILSAIVLRLLGRRLIIMQDSKFDDKQRYLFKEVFKSLFYRPYHAAIVAGKRSESYLTFLGIPENRIFIGYDTVSLKRIRELAGSEPAPGGIAHSKRHFTIVARFLPKKNLSLALDAYAAYLASHTTKTHATEPRELHLCGSGELETELREKAEGLELPGVHFRGYLQESEIAEVLGSTLALILPSIEEQHGLVVNEALAMGLPVLLSDNCGARDLLVRTGVNGYVFEADNVDGLAHFMALVDQDEGEWRRLSEGARRFAHLADTTLFVAAVEQAVDLLSGLSKPSCTEAR